MVTTSKTDLCLIDKLAVAFPTNGKTTETRKPDTSDLTDAPWEFIRPFIPVWKVGRPRKTDMREALNAIFYLLTQGLGRVPAMGYETLNAIFYRRTSGCAWKTFPMTFRRKERFAMIFLLGNARGHGAKFTMLRGKRFVSSPVASRRPVREVSIRKAPSRPEPPGCA